MNSKKELLCPCSFPWIALTLDEQSFSVAAQKTKKKTLCHISSRKWRRAARKAFVCEC